LKISFEKNNLTDTYYIVSNLELNARQENNVQNLTAAEYKERVFDVFSYLWTEYGIKIDYSAVKINKLEINATFFLSEAFEKYRQVILLIMRNVPPRRFKDRKNNGVLYATWHEANMKTKQDKLETAVVKNHSIELKIYNKTKELSDKGKLSDGHNLPEAMRVEYVIKERRLIADAFGDNLVSSITDEKMRIVFKKYFQRDVISQYQKWKERNHKELLQLTKQCRKTYQKWVGYFLRQCRQYEAVHGLPVLIDLDDMKTVIRELEPRNNRNEDKKFSEFKNQAVYEKDLLGNTKRIEEIFQKVMEM
jgi:hypothetical protein